MHESQPPYVSRPDAFARLYPKLLGATSWTRWSRSTCSPPAEPRLAEFVASIAAAARSRRPSAGLGGDVRLRGKRVVGSGLELDDELIQLCAFSSDGSGLRRRIARPSRRT